MTVPCGKCGACRSNRRTDWVTRLQEESKLHPAWFITLTYTEENVPKLYTDEGYLMTLEKTDLQKFFKRLRKMLKSRIKYYAVGEYGSKTLRPHYHIILFGISNNITEVTELIIKAWMLRGQPIGKVDVQHSNTKALNYTLKYILKQNKDFLKNLGVNPNFSLMSKNLGINYVEKRKNWHLEDTTRNYVVKENGLKTRLPRYYKEKLYDKRTQERNGKIAQETNIEKWARLSEFEKRQTEKNNVARNQLAERRINKNLKQEKL